MIESMQEMDKGTCNLVYGFLLDFPGYCTDWFARDCYLNHHFGAVEFF